MMHKEATDEMTALLKAHKVEKSPYRSFNQISDQWERYCHEVTTLLLQSVSKVLNLHLRKASSYTSDVLSKAADSDASLVFKGRIQYNPSTGRPIKQSDWKKLEEAIKKFLGAEVGSMQEKMISDSFWLGTLINRLNDETKRVKTSLKKIDLRDQDWSKFDYTDYDTDQIQVSQQAAGIYLQNVSDNARSQIQKVLTQGVRDHTPKHKLYQNLWDLEEDINRDWDRVVRTETSYATSNGNLISQLRQEPDEEHIFMIGLSAPGACDSCDGLIHDRVVVLVEKPSDSDSIDIDGKTYTAIWPGKTNFGRTVRNYWTTVPMHPYCRCLWTRWFIELEDYMRS